MSKPIDARQAEFRVLQYEPPRFDLGIPGVALEALENQKKSSGFHMSEIIRKQTGIKELEAQSYADDVERKAMERLKEIQEGAYKEAYDLGLDEGRKEAFRNASNDIESRLNDLDQLIVQIEGMKAELLAQNESHLVQLTFHMAKRLAAQEVSADPEATLNILKQSIELAQAEENITVKVAPAQFEFIESIKQEGGRGLEALKKMKLESDKDVGIGGCIVITNYGEIDSRFEERVGRLWEALSANIVKVKEKLKSVS